MNYPNNIKKNYQKVVSYSNRGIDLENLINIANQKYIEENKAAIYKKPTPIQVVKYNYSENRICDAFYKEISTLDYNGIYKGYYIEFDAKNTNLNNLPLANIAKHQLEHIKRIIFHKGIVFLLIMINNECYVLRGRDLLDFIDNNTRKSIPYNYIKEKGINIEFSYLKGINYLPALDILIKEIKNEKIEH